MGNCQRRQKRERVNQSDTAKEQMCPRHKVPITHICYDEKCTSKGDCNICRKCLIQFHIDHQVEELKSFQDQIDQNCSILSSLQSSIRQVKNYQNMQTTQRDLMRPFLQKRNHTVSHTFSETKPKIEESIRLKLKRTAEKIYKEQDKQQTEKEDEVLNAIENMADLSCDPMRQNLIANFQFSSTYQDMINYHIYQSSQQMNQMAQSVNPYKFDYSTFQNQRKSMLIIQKDLKYMKLKTCCRIDARFAAIHFRNHLNESDFYIIDLIDENVIYTYKHKPSHAADFDYLYKISYLGNYFICFNFITYILIKDFRTLIQNSSHTQQQQNVRQEFIGGIFHTNILTSESPQNEEVEKKIKTIKIIPKNLVFSVDKVKCGQLCLMEQQSEFFIEIRDYSIWNFKKKQCIRTLNITGHYVYDIFNNYIVLECSFHTFTLFNWQTNQVHKQYLNLFNYLNKFNAKADSEQYYDIQAVKIFAIQKLLTTKDDTFLNSQPSFEDWLKSLPFQYKSMIIFEDTWLFKYDRTAIIMLQESLLIYDMNLNKIVTQLELKIPSDQISFIWQAGNKLVYITKEGLFLFYK